MGDTGSNKRKENPNGGEKGPFKKSKGGVGGRWQTPHQKSKSEKQIAFGAKVEVGDAGLWVTYARGQRPRAVREFVEMSEEYGQSMYGIKPVHTAEEETSKDQDEAEDIEASIKAELEGMKDDKEKKRTEWTFAPVNTGIECVFFLKAKAPVVATDLARKMCLDARACEDVMQRKCKYVNRIIPVVDTDRATTSGIEKVGRAVLGKEFWLKPVEDEEEEAAAQDGGKTFCSYAIRYNIRHNKELKSSELIPKVASLVDPKHKVNLGNPDKVILVEVFQMYCSMSVVDGAEWESLKRYNLNELYRFTDNKEDGAKKEDESKDAGRDSKDAKPEAETAATTA